MYPNIRLCSWLGNSREITVRCGAFVSLLYYHFWFPNPHQMQDLRSHKCRIEMLFWIKSVNCLHSATEAGGLFLWSICGRHSNKRMHICMSLINNWGCCHNKWTRFGSDSWTLKSHWILGAVNYPFFTRFTTPNPLYYWHKTNCNNVWIWFNSPTTQEK